MCTMPRVCPPFGSGGNRFLKLGEKPPKPVNTGDPGVQPLRNSPGPATAFSWPFMEVAAEEKIPPCGDSILGAWCPARAQAASSVRWLELDSPEPLRSACFVPPHPRSAACWTGFPCCAGSPRCWVLSHLSRETTGPRMAPAGFFAGNARPPCRSAFPSLAPGTPLGFFHKQL